MRTVATHGSFDDVVAQVSDATQALARGVRALIVGVFPDVVEVPWPRQKTVGYGVGPRKMTEHFCWIGVYRGHVNLGFNYGVDLADPANVLEGTGKSFRHVRIGAPADIERACVRALVEAAIAERRAACGTSAD